MAQAMSLSAPFLVRGVLQNQPVKCMVLQIRVYGVVVFLPSGHTDKKVPGVSACIAICESLFYVIVNKVDCEAQSSGTKEA